MGNNALDHAGISVGAHHLCALLENSTEMHALLSADSTFLFANPPAASALGYSLNELIGRSGLDLVHPDDRPMCQERLAELLAKPGGSVHVQCRLLAREGPFRWVEATAKNLLDDPEIGAIVVSYRDVSDRVRAEAERQVISEVIHALTLTNNLDELLGKIHKALKKVLAAENCFVALYDRSTGMFHFPFFVDQYDTAPPSIKAGRSCTAYVYRTGRPMLISQEVFDQLAARGEVELVGSPSPTWLGVPLQTPSETIGVLVVQHYEDKNAYNERDLQFLASVGGHIALAIERKRTEEALGASESLFRLLFSHNPLPTWLFDKDTLQFLEVNDKAIAQYGYSREEFLQLRLTDVRPEEDIPLLIKRLQRPWGGAMPPTVWRHRTKGGRIFEAEVTSHDLEFGGRRATLVVAQDITERKHLEDQLRQAQKMEAVGRLAGGVAHDFNNLLMIVKGHAELLLQDSLGNDRLRRKVEHIDKAADRATALTRQLLAFSRMQVLQPKVISLNIIVEELGRLLPRLIGEDVELLIRTDQDLGLVRADATQMEQVILNLAVNSRDAMPDGGRLVIETSNAKLDSPSLGSHPVMMPGRYVLLTVTDTGSGMDAETQAHIFEPFFTTKEKGKGTGLGLATVYGVVKQSGGHIWVYSEPGKGSSFKIYLPCVDEALEESSPVKLPAELPHGAETILLAEDEQDVREIAREFLTLSGYTVLEAKDGAEALEVAQNHAGTIHLLLTDLVMPGISGRDLAAHLSLLRPDLKVIFMSGYTEYSTTHHGGWDPSSVLLTKPFTRGTLVHKVRDVICCEKSS